MKECKNVRWNDEEITFIKENYLNMTNKELGNYLNRTESSVQTKIKKLNIHRPEKYTYNTSYFHNIDCEDKAYWLGFFCSDGFVSGNEATISISEKDISLLKEINKSVNGNLNITHAHRSHKINGREVHIDCCTIRFRRKEIIDDLISHGCIPNKTFKLKFPNEKQIPNTLLRHFLRGYFDGNGCVCEIKERKELRFYFSCASIDFINGITEYLSDNNIKSYYRKQPCRCYEMTITGIENTKKFANLLYKDSNIFLNRKYDKFMRIYNKYNLANRGRA